MTVPKKNKIGDTSVPITICPRCSGNCYPKTVDVVCEKCDDTFSIDSAVLEGNIKFTSIFTEEMNRYMKYLLHEKDAIAQQEAIEEDDAQSLVVTYKGQILSVLKTLKKNYKFPTLLLVIKYITEGFFYILGEMKAFPGDKVYLVDDLGNKSKELNKEFLRNAYDSFNSEKDRELVSRFIKDLWPKKGDNGE